MHSRSVTGKSGLLKLVCDERTCIIYMSIDNTEVIIHVHVVAKYVCFDCEGTRVPITQVGRTVATDTVPKVGMHTCIMNVNIQHFVS